MAISVLQIITHVNNMKCQLMDMLVMLSSISP